MSTVRYIVAKYIPDLWRMEPRNIGVIVWSAEGVVARFLAEKADRPGSIDKRRLPSYVTSGDAFAQWIHYWRSALERPQLEPIGGGSPVPKASPEFVEVLSASSRGNFILADGGFLLDDVRRDGLSDLAEHLYHMLVDNSTVADGGILEQEPRDQTLDLICTKLIGEARLFQDQHFKTPYSLTCNVGAVVEHFTFSYAYVNGSIKRLYQCVPLPKSETLLRKTVHDAAWMFSKVIENKFISQDQGVALVQVSKEQSPPEVANALGVLASAARVLNVADTEVAVGEFRALTDLGNSLH